MDKGGIDIHLHILPYKEIQRRTGQQKEHKPGFSAGIHQDTSYKEYYLPIFNGCQIKNNQKTGRNRNRNSRLLKIRLF